MSQDNRIRFPSTRVDFATDVGLSGQNHDNYPAPNSQLRFDWMRLFLIGLLSNQSSTLEPTEFRNGTLWFDSTDATLKIRIGDSWKNITSAIEVAKDSNNQPITMAGFYSSVASLIGLKPPGTFSGRCQSISANTIPIPSSLRACAGQGSHPFIWIDGKLVDPRLASYSSGESPSSILLSGAATLSSGQNFTVVMLGMSSDYFGAETVTV